jgi:hypothetical protein
VATSYATTISVSVGFKLAVYRLLHAYTEPRGLPDADQSCAQCGEQGIQLVPLQQNVCRKIISIWQFFTRLKTDGRADV